MKIRPVEADLFHADRKTGEQKDWRTERDMMHLIVTFGNLAKTPRNSQDLITCCCLIKIPNVEVS
jgi:hypothetical protein